ncbi:MAG: DUF3373 family protein [Nitrospirae bacterium]|nr:DUF3373 family protein [Nitrospirota bacterium]
MKKLFAVFLVFSLIFPVSSFADEKEEILKKIEGLTNEIEKLKRQVEDMKTKDVSQEEKITSQEDKIKEVEKKADKAADISRFTLSGDYRFRIDSIRANFPAQYTYYYPAMGFGSAQAFTAKNDSIMTHRFRLNIAAQATENIGFVGRLAMFKVAGGQTSTSLSSGTDPMFGVFAHNGMLFDGNTGHLATDNVLRVDRAFVNWINVGGLPVAFSVGRRPSAGGPPTHLRQNIERDATPLGLGIDYAFDGVVAGYFHNKPLPGNFKLCYGRGFESGFKGVSSNKVDDVDFFGFNEEVDDSSKNIFFQLQGFKAFDLMDVPEIQYFVNQPRYASTNVGDLYHLTTLFMHKIANVDWFISGGSSRTEPKNQSAAGFGSLLTDPGTSELKEKTGYAVYTGLRIPVTQLKSKVGFEYNYGSKNWVTLTPASDDLITSKLATRGSVYEAYWIWDIPGKQLSKYAKTFIRIGYQYYDFDYSGSGLWLGEPKNIDEINTTTVKPLFPAAKNMYDIYATFDVYF